MTYWYGDLYLFAHPAKISELKKKADDLLSKREVEDRGCRLSLGGLLSLDDKVASDVFVDHVRNEVCTDDSAFIEVSGSGNPNKRIAELVANAICGNVSMTAQTNDGDNYYWRFDRFPL